MDDFGVEKTDTKRYKPSKHSVLSIDTSMGPPEQINARQPTSTSSQATYDSKSQSLFLSLSTSPINTDVDATPLKSNATKPSKQDKNKDIFKLKDDKSDRPSLSDVCVLSDDHLLNKHLRGQSFTPLAHASNNDSPSHAAFVNSIAPQLSWSIAGDTVSLGDLAEWEEKSTAKARPASAASIESRGIMVSPRDFNMWHEEGIGGTTTPLPAFFGESSDHSKAQESHRHPGWSLDVSGDRMGVPPTPVFSTNGFRDDQYPRSPHGQHNIHPVMDYYQSFMHHHHHMVNGGGPNPNDRVRNLRGRVPSNGSLPMPLHIPPSMAHSHLSLTSPMSFGQAKGSMWGSPHGNMHHPMCHPQNMTSPLSSMAQSKRKCVPLKAPVPSKFQGDAEKAKNMSIPEFANLVNFPAHISQKQQPNLPEGMRCCVMCGSACASSHGAKKVKKAAANKSDDSNGPEGNQSGFAVIPSQNKGLCTACDVNVWVVTSSGLQIKWCKGCKNFRSWASFGDKGLATKCLRCRERQREKYALQKEEKEKTRVHPSTVE